MPINVKKNVSYGGNLVTEKYQPLDAPSLSTGDLSTCYGLFKCRIDELSTLGRLPKLIKFYTGGKFTGVITTNETKASARPPIIVISSNRSGWIKKGFERAQQTLDYSDTEKYVNENDLLALKREKGEDKTYPSPPLYCPIRINDENRQVYILVHIHEYAKYNKALKDFKGITVVGWTFGITQMEIDAGNYPFVGFGASRYAAIQFAKKLRTVTGATGAAVPWNKVWLMDDNTVYINNFPGFTKSDAYMASHTDLYALGFTGGTRTDSTDEVVSNARTKWTNGDSNTYTGLAEIGLLQQCVLWNLSKLDTLNFSPYFICSAEDTSLTNYLNLKGYKYNFSTVSVKKETAVDDGDPTATSVNNAREFYIDKFAGLHGTLKVIAELAVEKEGKKEGEQTLADFINTVVLPKSQLSAKAGDAATRKKTVVLAVEQILSEAVKKNGFTPDKVFFPNWTEDKTAGVQEVVVL